MQSDCASCARCTRNFLCAVSWGQSLGGSFLGAVFWGGNFPGGGNFLGIAKALEYRLKHCLASGRNAERTGFRSESDDHTLSCRVAWRPCRAASGYGFRIAHPDPDDAAICKPCCPHRWKCDGARLTADRREGSRPHAGDDERPCPGRPGYRSFSATHESCCRTPSRRLRRE